MKPGELQEIAAGWRAWGEASDSVFVILHGELLAHVKPTET